MNPKEKANDLVNKMYREIDDYVPENSSIESMAKQCALVAVDEQIDMYNFMLKNGHIKESGYGFYLLEIKTEIEKL